MKVTINTESKTTIDCSGEYPVGHIKVLMNHYVDMAENLEFLMSAYKKRIQELEASDNPHKNFLIRELKNVFIAGGCEWDGEEAYEFGEAETDNILRYYPGDKLGYR